MFIETRIFCSRRKQYYPNHPIMKKIIILLAVVIFPAISAAQFCVTTFSGSSFGLKDFENSIRILEIDSTGQIWFGLRSDFSSDVGKYSGGEWI